MWDLIVELKQEICNPFISVINLSFEVALRELMKVSSIIQEEYHDWKDYDVVAYWAIGIINGRKNNNDEINVEAAKIIEYVASDVNRYDIKRASNTLKSNSSIDGHIRAQLSYYDGY